MALKIWLVDDHFVVRQGMRQIFGLYSDLTVVGESSSGDELMSELPTIEADLILLDMTMPGLCGTALITRIRQLRNNLPILVLSMHSEPQMAQEALRAGAMGYITKDSEPDTMAFAVRKVATGSRYLMPALAEALAFDAVNETKSRYEILSPRELEVLKMIGNGISITQISEMLHLSAKTVSTHKTRLMQKLRINNNAELILCATAAKDFQHVQAAADAA